jgi:hypothetical protein
VNAPRIFLELCEGWEYFSQNRLFRVSICVTSVNCDF